MAVNREMQLQAILVKFSLRFTIRSIQIMVLRNDHVTITHCHPSSTHRGEQIERIEWQIPQTPETKHREQYQFYK
jgi:hypothetical protein